MPDPDSYARPETARVTHVAIDLRADFERKVLTGTATLTIESAPSAREIVLDCDGLNIQSVRTEHGLELKCVSIGGIDALIFCRPETA